MFLSQQKRKGFLLIDALLGIFVLTTTLIIGIIVIRTGIERNLEVASRVTAIYLVQEKTEILRNIHDSNLVAGRPWNTGLLIVGERREEITLNRIAFTRITTTIPALLPPPEYINITVIVQWLYRGRLLQIETRKRLYSPPPPPNGIIPNGIIPNGIIPNGIIPNGIIPNGIIPNGIIL